MAQRGEAGCLQPHRLLHQLLDRASLHMSIQSCLVAHLAAEQFVDRDVEGFALDVPQRDVDRGNGAGDRAAGEVVGAQHHVPMVLDREGIAADQILAVFHDGRGGGFELPPGAGLADAGDARVGADADIQEPIEQQRFYFGDFHGGSFPGSVRIPASITGRLASRRKQRSKVPHSAA